VWVEWSLRLVHTPVGLLKIDDCNKWCVFASGCACTRMCVRASASELLEYWCACECACVCVRALMQTQTSSHRQAVQGPERSFGRSV